MLHKLQKLKLPLEHKHRVATQVVAKIDTRVNFGLIAYTDDYQEEVFAGVKQEIESDWNKNTC
jgi:hypothetical protein